MPSAQIIDFGPEPFTESIGNFAKNFSDAFFADQNRRKNDEIFNRIKQRYGSDASPERMLKDIIEAEGLDQDYKKNLVKDAKDYATLVNKKKSPVQEEIQELRKEELTKKNAKLDKEAAGELTPYQKRLFENQDIRLDNEKERIKIANDKNSKDLPKLIADHTNSLLRGADEKMSVRDKALLNSKVESNIKEGMPISDAYQDAFDRIQLKNETLETYKITPRPKWLGGIGVGEPNEQQLQQAMEEVYKQLNELYEFGIQSQTDLRSLFDKTGWKKDEINKLLQAVFESHGRKARVKPEGAPGVGELEQDKAKRDASLDNRLRGL